MQKSTKNTVENNSHSVASHVARQNNGDTDAFQITDKRPKSLAQKTLQRMMEDSPRVQRMHRFQRIANNTLQRLTDEDVAEMTKEEKKRLEALKKKYNSSLGVGSPLYQYTHDGYDYHFGQASSLDNLDKRINDEIARATARKQAADNPAPAPAPVTVPAAVPKSAPPPGPPQILAPKKAKKPKPVDITKSVVTGGPKKTQAPVSVPQPVTNPQIQQWIVARPAGAQIEATGMEVKQDTVYIYARVTMRDLTVTDYIQYNTYDIETHYHPVPISANYLHVKRSAAADAGNIAGPACWLIPGGVATLRAAKQAWDAANPQNISPHNW